MVKVIVGDVYGPTVLEVKGLRGGRGWVSGEIEARRGEVDIPSSLRRRIVVSQAL